MSFSEELRRSQEAEKQRLAREQAARLQEQEELRRLTRKAESNIDPLFQQILRKFLNSSLPQNIREFTGTQEKSHVSLTVNIPPAEKVWDSVYLGRQVDYFRFNEVESKKSEGYKVPERTSASSVEGLNEMAGVPFLVLNVKFVWDNKSWSRSGVSSYHGSSFGASVTDYKYFGIRLWTRSDKAMIYSKSGSKGIDIGYSREVGKLMFEALQDPFTVYKESRD